LYDHPNVYTVSFKDGSISECTEDLLSLVLENRPINTSTLLPPWVKGGANATLFLHTMPKPRHGTIQQTQDGTRSFHTGKSSTDGITLSDLEANCQELLDTGQLFNGHAKFKNVYDARSQVSLRECVLRHVASSLKHHSKLHVTDKEIRDNAYNKEYDGLNVLPSWEIVTEAEHHRLRKGQKALPTMAIATIKYDEHNRPKHAKYRIVVLGNPDYHSWSKEATAAPVLSQLFANFFGSPL